MAAEAAAEVGRALDNREEDDRRMIRLVRDRPLLYVRSNMPVASYYSQVKELWQEVADRMGCTVADVRRKWSHVRNSYSRHLRNEMQGARTGRGRAVSRWYLADALEFLRKHMATDITRYSPYSFNSLVKTEEPEQIEVKPSLSPSLMLSVPASPPPSQAGPPSSVLSDDSSHSFAADEASTYFQFFRGLYGEYEELSARRQREFKRGCLTLLHRLLDESDADARAVNLSGHNIKIVNVVSESGNAN